MLPISVIQTFTNPRVRRASLIGIALAILHLAPVAAEEPGLYTVGPNDVLAITVFDQPQLTGKYTVQTDGSFTFPLLGHVKVGGLSMPAIEDELRDRLSRGFLKNPQVGVAVDQYRSQQVFVMGEVRQPGSLQFTGVMTVIEALARVGSTTERAAREALIIRFAEGAPVPDVAAIERARDSNESDVMHIDLQTLQKGAVNQNVLLRGGDTVFVPRAESVFVSGHVSSPGEFTVRKGMTVRQVLALAGGVTERGSTGRIQIIRNVDGQERTVGATLQDVVQPGDTIVVRERFF